MTKRAELWRRQFLAAVLAAVTLGVLALGATPAFGAFTYAFEEELAPSSPFGFLDAGSVAVNDANDHTYVADSSAGVVDVFETSTGTQLPTWDGSALSNPPGTPAGSFGGGAVAVAANNGTGDVYVLDSTDNVVDELSPSGEYLGQLTGANATGTGTLTSGSKTIEGVTTATGAFSVGEEISAPGLQPGTQIIAVNGSVLKVSQAAMASGSVSLTAQRPFSTPRGITVDQATGEVYVLDPNHTDSKNEPAGVVDVFSVAGDYLRQISLSQAPFIESFNTRGIAVNDFNGHVYVASTSSGARLYEFDASGNFLATSRGTNTPAGSFGSGFISVAADDASGDVFVTVTETSVTEPAVTDVFNPEGEYLTQFSHSYSGPRGTTVDQASHKVYVSDDAAQFEGPGTVDIFAPLVIPDVSTEVPSQVMPTSATLNGKLNPLEVALTDCHFNWGTSSAYGQSAPCSPSAGEIAADSSEHAVSAQLTNLVPDTTYHYRLQASNANGTSEGHDVTFTTAGAGIHAESVTDVAATSVTFNATIDPNNAPTSYYFQYASADTTTCGTSCPSIPAPPGQAIGSETGDVEVHQHLQEGLAPSSTYHYRVVALSEVKAGETVTFFGADQTFTTQGAGAFALPDGRAWEMVSPADKHGSNLLPIGGANDIQSAAAGQAMSYLATSPTETNPQGFTNSESQVLARRTAEGWRSQNLAVPHSQAPGQGLAEGEYRLFSPDLSLAVLQPLGSFEPALSEEASEQTAYLRTDFLAGGVEAPCLPATMHCYRPLVTAKPPYANVPQGTVFGGETEGECLRIECGPEFQGTTPDFSHIVLSSHVRLTPTPIEASVEETLYEWSAGALQLASVLPQGEGGGGVAAILGDRGGLGRKVHTISGDGARVIWTAAAAPGHLYLRDMVKGETVRLDAVQGGSGEGVPDPRFQLASSDGSRVLFTDEQRLTAGAGAEKDAPDLYECDIVAEPGGLGCKLTDLTPANGGEHANVSGVVLGAGEDASRVYFVAEGALAPGAEPGSCSGGSPAAAGCKLYVRQGGVTRLVAAISPQDGADWSANSGESHAVTKVPVRVSPDGRWVAFMSQRRLTSADNRDALSGQADEEVYVYDADSQRLVCASCDPTGARPAGEQFGQGDTESFLGGNNAWGKTWAAAQIPGWTNLRYQSRYLSDSGRLFFNSHDALVPQDVNGTWDVYEYEPPGAGGCSASAEGFNPAMGACVGLISSGTSPEPSAFLDASVSGADVFFLTSAKLSSQDVDTSVDVYDARECSAASPCLSSPAPPAPPCDTEASCKAAPSPQPDIFGSPASATFSGQGNLAPSPPSASKPPTRAQKLAKALSSCRKKYRKSKKRRASCERAARKAYGARRPHVANAGKSGR